ncbi:MAG: ABC transporter permease [Cyanobacteria bacterium P01_E01_bin.42]
MKTTQQSVCISEFLQRVGSLPDSNVWSVLIVNPEELKETVEDLEDGIDIFIEADTETISGAKGVHDLIEKVENSSEIYLILWDFELWESIDWQQLDRFRTHLEQQRGGVFVLSFEAVEIMAANAPNLLSWFRSRVYHFLFGAEYLTEEEEKERLQALQEWFKLSNEEVIELAEKHQLPSEPAYAEWLILLNRGDLIVTR